MEADAQDPDYVLGTSDFELERLEFQQAVWEAPTRAWIEGLRLRPGGRVLDAGCGPGTALHLTRGAVGELGRVTALDESPRWLAAVERRCTERGWDKVERVQGRIEQVPDFGPVFDAILMRWVLSFPPDPSTVVRRLASWLAPGGRLLVIDYNHEGISVFPWSPAFVEVIEATRALYASQGGNPWIAGELPRLFADGGLELESYEPIVQSGAPGSEVWRWAEVFFLHHAERMEQAGFLPQGATERFRCEWTERSADPAARFFSPIVVGAIGVR
jgi:ubiquinone/menaquinone biosynthesis C-methylase UbiE